MPGYVRVVRGTFDQSQLESATSLAVTVAEQLRDTFEHFERLVSMKDEDGRFIWLAHFAEQSPISLREIEELWERFQEQAQGTSIPFEIEEFGTYEVTYSGPEAPGGPAA